MKTSNITIEQILDEQGYFLQTISGVSMRPMLRDKKDSALIVKPTFPLKKYDVPLYKTKDEKYVLHRIVKIKDGAYIIRGDNTYFNELGVLDKDIVGVLSAFYRGEKYYKVDSGIYKFYVRLNIFFYPLRFAFFKCKSFIKKALKKIFKKK